MGNKYAELKKRQQEELNAIPMFFAFSNEQFDKGMRLLGLEPGDTDKIFRLKGVGGYIRRTDSEALHELLTRHDREKSKAIEADKTGKGFIEDMFCYELANHEYGYTLDTEDTLDALGLTVEEIQKNPVMLAAWERAKKAQLSAFD